MFTRTSLPALVVLLAAAAAARSAQNEEALFSHRFRSSIRAAYPPRQRVHNVGFRVVVACGETDNAGEVSARNGTLPELAYTPPTRNRLQMSAGAKARLQRALRPYHERYDPAVKMLRSAFHSPGYHTTLTGGQVHRTRESLTYATALLDTGDEKWLDRACDILMKVISLQDRDPVSRTYGIWSWFYEEPLEKMSPPDWNWADFCGVQLLQVARDHRHRFPRELAAKVDGAIYHAVRSIMKRNVGPGYTNIAIMGTYATLLASELYGLDDVAAYARRRLQRLYDHTMKLGGFNEYNSPTYSIVALHELSRMRQHIFEPRARGKVEALYDLAWKDVAMHFHPPSGQWAGPHSRCYSTLLRDSTKYELQRSLGGAVDFGCDRPSITEQRLVMPCPERYVPYFVSLDQPRLVVRKYAGGNPPVIGTSWLTKWFTLGSVNYTFTWNQRRGLLAYWGTPEAPAFMRFRLLRNGYDFSDGYLFTAQEKGRVLAALNFALDGGNRHCSLDRIRNGLFTAEDLRVRFEFGGSAAGVKLKEPEDLNGSTVLDFGDVRIAVGMPFAGFDGHEPRWESGREGDRAWLDCVLWSGEERTYDLRTFECAALGFAVEVGDGNVRTPRVDVDRKNNRLSMKWGGLKVAIPVTPAGRRAIVRGARW